MKKIFLFFVSILILEQVVAQEYAIVDGIRYGYAVDTAFVADGDSIVFYSGDIEIPSHVNILGNDYTVNAIGKKSFKNSAGLTSIKIPNSVTMIDTSAFYNCTGLTSVTIPSSLCTIGATAFWGCSNLTEISLSEGLVSIGSYAFRYCNFSTLKLPNSLIKLYNDVFRDCQSLLSIIIPENVKYIGNGCFNGCSNLKTIMIPEGVEIMGNHVFYACKSLKTVTIPSTVTELGYYVFSECSNLEKIIVLSNTPPKILQNVEEDYLIPLTVPCEALEAYQNDTIWGQFINIECMQDYFEIESADSMALINLSDYIEIADEDEEQIIVTTSDPGIVKPVVVNNNLALIPMGEGTAEIGLSQKGVFLFSCIVCYGSMPLNDCNIEINESITNNLCYGDEKGKIEINVTIIEGKKPQYTWYEWYGSEINPWKPIEEESNSFIDGISTGRYMVSVSADGCETQKKEFYVGSPDEIQIQISSEQPNCEGKDGVLHASISGGVAPYTYQWDDLQGNTYSSLEVTNLSVGLYKLTVTDANLCTTQKQETLSSETPPITDINIVASKCNEPTGRIDLTVSDVTGYSFSWKDAVEEIPDCFHRSSLKAGLYQLIISNDDSHCQGSMFMEVPLQHIERPKISLVSYGEESKKNFIVWTKNSNEEVDCYTIWRENNDDTHLYEEIGRVNKEEKIAGDWKIAGSNKEIDVFVFHDSTVNNTKHPLRYKISSENECEKSPLSKKWSSIYLWLSKEDFGNYQLEWTPFEGCNFYNYYLYRTTTSGFVEFIDSLSLQKSCKYIDRNPTSETTGYYVSVKLPRMLSDESINKAESGPYTFVISNIAELENFAAIPDIYDNVALVYAKGKNIVVETEKQRDVIVYDIMGKIVARQKSVQSTIIPVKTAGVYVVVVGEKAYKLTIKY